jgi:hypothetical protein
MAAITPRSGKRPPYLCTALEPWETAMASSFEVPGIVSQRTHAAGDPLRRNPLVFLIGSPRSGTTLLKRMVDAHPLIAITRETHWIPGFYRRRRALTEDGRVTPALVDKLFEHPRFAQIKTSRDRLLRMLAKRPDMPYATLVSQMFDHYGERQGKPLVGDKTPTYVREIPVLAELWPATRFAHLVRDGRDVYLSLRNWRKVEKAAGAFATWNSDPATTAALWWKALVGLGRQDGRDVAGSRYCELAYEALVREPESHCRAVAQFLGVPYAATMHRYYAGRTDDTPGLSANAAWLPPQPGRRDWRRDLSADEAARFEAVAGDLLEALGYERAYPRIPPSAARAAARTRAEFTAEAQARNWRLPIDW